MGATKLVLEATAEWKSPKPRWLQVAAFRKLIDKNSLLGFPKNLERDKYVHTPLIDALGREDDFGSVSVMMVPPSLGKTTAAYCLLRANKDVIRGIAFCGHCRGIPYVESMLDLLGLDCEKPPSGWLNCLVEALQEGPRADRRRPVLILDDFYSFSRDDADAALMMTLKTVVTNTNIRAIVLTNTEECANNILTLSNLQGIVPYVDTYEGRFPEGHWKSMLWPVPTLKAAAIRDPLFAPFGKKRVYSEIEQFVKGLPETDREELTIRAISNHLRRVLLPLGYAYDDPLGDASFGTRTEVSSLSEGDQQFRCGTGTQSGCCIS